MSFNGVSRLSLTDLNRVELIRLGDDTVKETKNFLRSYSKEALLIAQLQQLERSLQDMEQAQVTTKTTGMAGRLEQADLARDKAFRTVRSWIKAHALIPTEAIQTAYALVYPVIHEHREIVGKSYEVQSQQTKHLLAELKKPTYQQAIAHLSLQPHLTALEVAQVSFEKVYKERVLEQATLTPGQLKERRKNLEKDYRLLVDLVGITNEVLGKPTHYQDLLKKINALRARYRKTQQKSRGKSSPKAQETEVLED